MDHKKIEEEIPAEAIVETEEETTYHTPKKRRFTKKILVILFAFVFLAIGIAGAYLADNFNRERQLKNEIVKDTPKDDTSNKPGSSSITSSPYSIQLTTDESIPARQITIPNLKISFNAPIELRTGQELQSSIHDENNAQSVVRLYRVDTKYTKDTNGYDVADNTIIFSFDYPYGTDPIFSTNQVISQAANDFMGTISFSDSLLASSSARFSEYYDTRHLRYDNKFTDTYKAIVRMDVVTDKGKRTTVGMVYSCYDQVDNDFCRKTFQTFVSSVKIEQASFEVSMPMYTEPDVFGLFQFTKKNLNSEKILLWYDARLFDEPFYREEEVPAIAKLKDEELQNIRCMPQTLFFASLDTYPTEVVGFYAPTISDPNLNKILNQLKSRVTEGNVFSQLRACQTEDKKYLIKYNISKPNQAITRYSALGAKIALLDDQGKLEDIVEITNKNAFCGYFVALTKDNNIYFSCVSVSDNNPNGIDMYKIDIAKKEYKQVYKCVFPRYPQTDMSKYCESLGGE